MINQYYKYFRVFIVLTVFLSATIISAYAAMDMEALETEFNKETGKQWSEVSSEERRDYMYKVRGIEEKIEREKRVEGVVVPYYIREGFRRDHKKNWENATENEQKSYIEEYKKQQRKDDLEAKKQLREEEARLRKIEREKKNKERELLQKKRAKEREKKAKQRELENTRRENKRKLEDAREKRTELQKKLKEMRKKKSR